MTAPTDSTQWVSTKGPSSSVLHTLEWSCLSALSGGQLASVCRVCEAEGANIHQLLYLAYEAAPSVLRLLLKSSDRLEALEQSISLILDNPS